MQRLHFTPATGLVKTIPMKTTENFEVQASGELRRLPPIHSEYKTVPDLSDRETLRLYRVDLQDAPLALAWITGQGEINITTQRYEIDGQGRSIPARLEEDGEVVKVPVYGTFNRELNEDDIHEIVEDYGLLHSYFPSYQDIFLLQTGANKFQAAIIEHLIEAQEAITNVLSEAGFRKDLPSVPRWIKRVLQLRKQK
jgi:hypothetical protein